MEYQPPEQSTCRTSMPAADRTDRADCADRSDRDNGDDDVEQILTKLTALPIARNYPNVLSRCRPILTAWREEFAQSDPALWRRMKRALPKELNECAFVVEEVARLLGGDRGHIGGGNHTSNYGSSEAGHTTRTASTDRTENNEAYDEESADSADCSQHNQHDDDDEAPYTIIDLCSGVGYLSMFLSHVLPPERCSRIVPIDTLFRLDSEARISTAAAAGVDNNIRVDDAGIDTFDVDIGNTDEKRQQLSTPPKPEKRHLSTAHLTSHIHPIPIVPRKANIKKSRELRQISQHVIDKAPGKVIILGIHLCKALSVHAIRLFNGTANDANSTTANDRDDKRTMASSSKVCRLYLKPCCLPGRAGLRHRHPPFWTFEHMTRGGFGVTDLYSYNSLRHEIHTKADDDLTKGTDDADADADADTADAAGAEGLIDENNAWALKRMGREAAAAASTAGGGGESQHKHKGNGHGHVLFDRWTKLLCRAVDTTDTDAASPSSSSSSSCSSAAVTVEIRHVEVQERHFQNQYIVASRSAR